MEHSPVAEPDPEARHPALAERILDRKARRVLVPPRPGESFRWYEVDFPAAPGRLTVHPEFEVQLIRRGRGHVVVGDRSRAYEETHIALIGANVPHAVIPAVADDEFVASASAVAHFSASWIESLDGIVPELHGVRRLLAESSRGLTLTGAAGRRARWEMEAIGRTRGPLRVGHLFGVLSAFTEAPQHERAYIASSLFSTSADPWESRAADTGLRYILDNLSTDLSLAGASIAAQMSVSAFSRHFKNATGSTFGDTVRSLRLASARRLLETTDLPITVVAERSGYRNLSNFNRQFRAATGTSPAQYRRR